jgi:hypothetical protein
VQPLLRRLVEPPSEVRPLEKGEPIVRGAVDDDRLGAQRRDLAGQLFRMKLIVNRVAGRGMGRLELEPFVRRQAATGPAQRDPGRRRASQVVPPIRCDGIVTHGQS